MSEYSSEMLHSSSRAHSVWGGGVKYKEILMK